jgi:hypothetical protein
MMGDQANRENRGSLTRLVLEKVETHHHMENMLTFGKTELQNQESLAGKEGKGGMEDTAETPRLELTGKMVGI